MEKYNYQAAVYDDVKEWIDNNAADIIERIKHGEITDYSDLWEFLNDTLFTEDRVTGNGSGSYTFSTWKAEENLCHNMDLLGEALRELGCDVEYLKRGAEVCDVTIRCYLLGSAISDVLEGLEGLEGKALQKAFDELTED